MKRIIMLLAGALVAGCQADSATSVTSPSAIDPATAGSTVAASPSAARLALDDVIDRIVPALEEGEGEGEAVSSDATRLAGALRAFRGAMAAGQLGSNARVARDAESALEAYARAHEASPADIDAIRLALNAAIVRY